MFPHARLPAQAPVGPELSLNLTPCRNRHKTLPKMVFNPNGVRLRLSSGFGGLGVGCVLNVRVRVCGLVRVLEKGLHAQMSPPPRLPPASLKFVPPPPPPV